MAGTLRTGQRRWSMERDSSGHRTYTLVHLVDADPEDGPAEVLRTPGLPLPGEPWVVSNDVDPWAVCRFDARVTPMVDNERNRWWEVEQTFSTKGDALDSSGGDTGGGAGLSSEGVEDPILEPMKVSGSFVKEKVEFTTDRYGRFLFTSSHEQLRGPQVEFDVGRGQVVIEQNVPVLELDLFSGMIDRLNPYPLWGCPPRTIKLSNAPWERKYKGTSGVYYTRRFEFDINLDGWDRDLLDEGTKALNGEFNETTGVYEIKPINGESPNPGNPAHFVRFRDRNGDYSRVVLNGAGLPAEVAASDTNAVFLALQATIGDPLSDTDSWFPTTEDYLLNGQRPNWDPDALRYTKGDLVVFALVLYVCVQNHKKVANFPPNLAPSLWRQLGPEPYVFSNQGTYADNISYLAGNYVSSSEATSIGTIFASVYGEADFLLLGIPTTF